jgi:hypothetical protein
MEYLEQVRLAVEQLHNCSARHYMTVAVHQSSIGETVGTGQVEVFTLLGHPRATRCYAWWHRDGDSDVRERFATELEIAPIESAETAVRAQKVLDARNGFSG